MATHIRLPYEFNAFESITAPVADTSLTAATRAGKSFVHITCVTADVQYRLDGGDSTSDGHLLAVGEVLDLEGQNNIDKFRFSRAGGSDGALKVSYAQEVQI